MLPPALFPNPLLHLLQIDDQTILITELPVGKWTTDYKQMLETMLVGAVPAAGKEDNPFSESLSLLLSVPIINLLNIIERH